MAKLYYKFGAMGSSKTASALMCRFNYIQKGQSVLLLKPALDTRSKKGEVTSRIGLSAPCTTFEKDDNLLSIYESQNPKQDVVIVDECQFCTKKQIDQLRDLAEDVPVLCYGLKTNFKTELFEGSKRLLEVADSICEIKSICECGKKAILNGRFSKNHLVLNGEEVKIGGDESYKSLCYSCYKKEKEKSMLLEKVDKYLTLFKNIESAGVWNTDTSADSIVLQKPEVLYVDDVKSFISDFKDFPPKSYEATLQSMKKYKPENKDDCLALISLAIKAEKEKPGLVKSLVENKIILKWLKQIKAEL